MCLVVAYQRLKTIENSKTVNRKSGRSQLWQVAIYERFQYKALTENIFGVLGRWLLIGGGRTWKFDCIKRHALTARPSWNVEFEYGFTVYEPRSQIIS